MTLINSIFFAFVVSHSFGPTWVPELRQQLVAKWHGPRKHCVYEALQSLRPEDLPTLKLRGSGDATKFQLFDEFHPNFATHQAMGRNLAELLEGKLKGSAVDSWLWVIWWLELLLWWFHWFLCSSQSLGKWSNLTNIFCVQPPPSDDWFWCGCLTTRGAKSLIL